MFTQKATYKQDLHPSEDTTGKGKLKEPRDSSGVPKNKLWGPSLGLSNTKEIYFGQKVFLNTQQENRAKENS